MDHWGARLVFGKWNRFLLVSLVEVVFLKNYLSDVVNWCLNQLIVGRMIHGAARMVWFLLLWQKQFSSQWAYLMNSYFSISSEAFFLKTVDRIRPYSFCAIYNLFYECKSWGLHWFFSNFLDLLSKNRKGFLVSFVVRNFLGICNYSLKVFSVTNN